MATAQGLTPRSVRKYHVILHSIFRRAVRDGLILTNPCEHTELPKIVLRRSRTLTPEEFDQLIQAIPERYRLMVETAIETGMRWGELIALSHATSIFYVAR
jgi:integrase